MSETINLQAVISVKDSGYTKAMQNAEKASEQLRNTTELTTSSISKASAVGSLAASAIQKAFSAITSSIGSAVSRLDTMNNFPKVMQSLGYTSDEATASINKLSDGINGLPTTLDGIVSSAQTLTASLGDLEKGTSSAIALNDMFLSGGQGAEAASRALTQYNQILAKGKVDQQSWNTLVEVAPAQMQQLAQSLLGASAGQKDLYEAVQAGKISVDEMNEAVIKLDQEGTESFQSFAEQAQAATGGIGTAWTNIQSAITKGVANVINAVDQAAQAADLPSISESLNMVKQAINQFFSAATTVASNITSAVAPAFKFLGDNIKTVATVAGTLVAGITAIKVVNTAKSQIDKFSDALKTSKERITTYSTALKNYGNQTQAVKNAEEQRQKATKMQMEADKLAKAATEASTIADKASEKALRAKQAAEESSGKATQKGANYSKLKTDADKKQKAAAEMVAKAEEAQAKATQQNVTANMAEAGAATVTNTQLSVKEVILGTLSGKLTAATAAQELFNAAMNAAGGPIGLAIAAVTGLISVISGLAGIFGGESEEAKKAREEEEAFDEACQEHIDSMQDIKKELEETSQKYDALASEANKSVDVITKLYKANGKETENKSQLTAEVQKLNDAYEDLNLTYDEESDSLNMSIDLMKQKVKVCEEGEKAKAIQESYNKALETETTLASDVRTRLKQVQEQRKKVTAAKQEYNNAVLTGSQYSDVELATWSNEQKKLEELQEEYNESANSYYEACQAKSQYAADYEAQIEALAAEEKTQNQLLVESAVQAAQEKQAALSNALATQTATLDMLSEKNQETVSSMNETWQGYVDHATDMFSTLDDTITITVDDMINNIEKNQSVINNWGTNMQSLRDRFSQLGLDDAILDQMQDLGPEGAGYVAALVQGSDKQLQRLASDFAQGGEVATTGMYNSMSTAGQQNLSQVQNLVTQTKDTLASEFENANFQEVGEDVLDGLVEGISDDSDLISQFKTLATNAGVVLPNEWQIHSPSKVFKDDGMYAVQGLAQGVKGYISTATNAVSNLARQTHNTLTNYNLRGKFQNIGTYAIQGLVNGLESQRSSVMSTANSIANAVSTTISKALQVHSPSRVMKKIGSYVGEGLAIGIEDSKRAVQRASQKLADATSRVSFDLNPFTASDYSFNGQLAFAGGGVLGISGIKDEIRDLKQAILEQPIKVDASFEASGRSIAKATATYMREENAKAEKISNRVGGSK